MLSNWLSGDGLVDRFKTLTGTIENFKAMPKEAPKKVALVVLANTLDCPSYAAQTKKIDAARAYCTGRMKVDLQSLPSRLTKKLSEALSRNKKTAAGPNTDGAAEASATAADSLPSASSSQTAASKPKKSVLKKIEKKRL